MDLQTLGTHALAWIVGIAMGAAGTYFGDKYTDKRRGSESEGKRKAAWKKVCNEMPELIKEMRDEWSKPHFRTTRTFYALHKGMERGLLGGPFITFSRESHSDLDGKLAILENLNLIVQTDQRGLINEFTVTEEFIQRLQA